MSQIQGNWTITEQDQLISDALERDKPRLRSFIRKHIADTNEAEDILQDVFYELIEGLPPDEARRARHRMALPRRSQSNGRPVPQKQAQHPSTRRRLLKTKATRSKTCCPPRTTARGRLRKKSAPRRIGRSPGRVACSSARRLPRPRGDGVEASKISPPKPASASIRCCRESTTPSSIYARGCNRSTRILKGNKE